MEFIFFISSSFSMFRACNTVAMVHRTPGFVGAKSVVRFLALVKTAADGGTSNTTSRAFELSSTTDSF